jgi:hypothetical protein
MHHRATGLAAVRVVHCDIDHESETFAGDSKHAHAMSRMVISPLAFPEADALAEAIRDPAPW